MHYGPLDDVTHIGQPPGGTRPPARRRRRRWPYFTAAAVVLLAGSGAAAWWLQRPAPTISVSGTLALKGADAFDGQDSARPCIGKGGYADITAGAQVVVYDPAGKVIGAGALDGGTPAAFDDLSGLLAQPVAGECKFTFAVTGLPTKTFYSFEVTHRGKVTYTSAQVTGGGVMLTLGS